MWHALGEAVHPIRLSHVAATIFTEPEIATAPIVIDGVTLFRVRGVSSLSAEARAQRIRNNFVSVAEDLTIPLDGIREVESDGVSLIQGGGGTIAGVLDADARLEQVRRNELAAAHLVQIRQAIDDATTGRLGAITPRHLGAREEIQ